MLLFAGLGNPGAKYAGNRHNIGFMAVERIAADHGFSPWRRAFKAEVAEGRLAGRKVLLLKPQTFMNLSGEALRAAADFYKVGPEAITVFHDELDLAPGRVRLKQGGGHAGHNGLRSIHAHLGEAYARVRLGIGHPGHKDAVAGYVLHDFAKADADWLEDVLRGLSDGAPALAEGDGARFLNAVALRTAPPRPSTGAGPRPQAPRPAPENADAARKPDRAGGPVTAAAPPTASETPAGTSKEGPAADAGAGPSAGPAAGPGAGADPAANPTRPPGALLQRLIDRFR